MAQKIAGTTYLTVRGRRMALASSCKVSPSRVNREELIGLSGVEGFKEMPVAPVIEAELYDVREVSVEDLEAITSDTVQVELANGKSYVLRDAFCASAFQISAEAGTFTAKFVGTSVEEVR
jgi:hypothetical protein